MNVVGASLVIAALLCGAVLFAVLFRRLLPEHHFSRETHDTVKVAMGLVATMTALVLGLMVSSAKESYDTVRSEVLQLSAQVAFLDRVLGLYGPETSAIRSGLSAGLQNATVQIWGGEGGGVDVRSGDAMYAAIQGLVPGTDMQRSLKAQAVELALELGQLRTLLRAQSMTTIVRPLLVVVVGWLVILFFSFSLFAPANATANGAMLIAALSVAGALFLILELDGPFTGLIKISNEPMIHALQKGPVTNP